MASLSRSGLGPEARDRRERRDVHYADESGARPLPKDDSEAVARYREYEARHRADQAALDEDVELPGVSPNAGLLFGIGVGIGAAVLVAAAGLYFGGYVGRSALADGPPMAELATLTAFDDVADARALELARIAPLSSVEQPSPAATELNSADIQVVDEAPAAQKPAASPQAAPDESSTTAPTSAAPNGLANELEELQQSLRPRGPVSPPREPSNATSPPEPSVPAPAEPTAPAETSPPESTNPY